MSAQTAPIVPLGAERPDPAARAADRQRGRIVTVLAPKGGLGKTTVAANLAVGLARVAPDSVVLIDADLQFGDVANVLDLNPAHTVPDLVTGAAATDDIVLKTLLTPHPAGFFVACGADSPVRSDGVLPAQVGALVRQLAAVFDWVVVDTTPGLGEHTLAALDEATDAVALSGLTVPNLRSLRSELAVLSTIGFAPAALHVVLNHAVDAGGLALKDAASILERPVDLVIPRSRAVPVSTNRGRPVLLDAPRDAASRSLTRLLARVTGRAERDFTRTRRSA